MALYLVIVSHGIIITRNVKLMNNSNKNQNSCTLIVIVIENTNHISNGLNWAMRNNDRAYNNTSCHPTHRSSSSHYNVSL
jgi:hypothetical protein